MLSHPMHTDALSSPFLQPNGILCHPLIPMKLNQGNSRKGFMNTGLVATKRVLLCCGKTRCVVVLRWQHVHGLGIEIFTIESRGLPCVAPINYLSQFIHRNQIWLKSSETYTFSKVTKRNSPPPPSYATCLLLVVAIICFCSGW